MAKLLLAEMLVTNITQEEAMKMTNDHARTPLHLASKRGHPDMVKWLLSKGASLTVSQHVVGLQRVTATAVDHCWAATARREHVLVSAVIATC